MLRHCLSMTIAVVLLGNVLSSSKLWAQGDTARLEGTVKDQSGAIVPNAKVTVTNDATGRAVTVTSNPDTGNFSVPGLNVGQYKIAVEAPAFRRYEQSVRLDPGQVANADIVLQPGSVNQTITVSDEAAVVESASSDLSTTFSARQTTDLPLNGRNFTQLAVLTPGVSRGMPGGAASGQNGSAETFRNSNSGGAALVVNGLRPQANNYLLDGADNNESLVNSIVFFPNVEAIQEFRVQTSIAPAEFGRAGGGIVNTSIKSGSNEIHGSVFEFLRNSALDARQTFAASRALFQRNQFGGTLGAPIIKNKFFIFGDYQGTRQNQPLGVSQVTVPTALMRTGNFSELLNPAVSGLSAPIQIHNVTTGAVYPGNLIPTTDLNKVGQAYLNPFPSPNITTRVEQNYLTQERQIQTFDDFDVRGDYVASQNDSLFGRFSFGRDSSVTSSEFPNLPAGFGTGSNFNQPRGFVLGETHIFSPTIVNELRLAWQREFLGYTPPLSNIPVSANLGIPNANRSPLLGGGALIGGNGSELEYTGDYGQYSVPENTYQIKDGVTLSHSKHTFKFGTDVIWRQVNYFRPIAGKGFFNLFGNGSGPATATTGYEVSDILAGYMSNYQIGAQSGYYGTRSWESGIFAQDDWKVNARLTLNLGVRNDLLTWPTEQFNRQSNFDLTNATIQLAGQNGVSASTIATDRNNFAPRVGFAYQLSNDGKTVFRGGYGMFYFIDRGGISNQLGQNPPFGGSGVYNYTSGYLFTLSGQGTPGGTPATATSALPPAIFPNFDPNNPANLSFNGILQNNRNSYVHEYNIQIQRELFPNSVLTVAYVGTLGRKLAFYYNANQQFFDAAAGARPYPNLSAVTEEADRGNSEYNSLQVQFEKRYAKGLELRAAYTYSKNMDDSDGAFDSPLPPNSSNFAAEHAPSLNDQKHLFVFSSIYDLPFGRGRKFGNSWNGITNAVLGGWQLNGIWTWASGLPFDIVQNGGPERPDAIAPLYVIGSTQQWFNTSAVQAVPTNSTGVFLTPGNLGRNAIYGPGFITVDASVFKDFSVTEKVKLQFRAQFYDIANHPRYYNPDANIGDANFGKITSTVVGSERQIEFSARIHF